MPLSVFFTSPHATPLVWSSYPLTQHIATNPTSYGVSYMLVEECLFFHVTSKRSADNTSSERFAGHIFRALRDMGALADRVVGSSEGGGKGKEGKGATNGNEKKKTK